MYLPGRSSLWFDGFVDALTGSEAGMEEQVGLHRTYEGPVGTFYDALTHGPLQLELRRVSKDDWRLLRRFGYRDHRYDEPFVCPHDVDDYQTDLASIPWFFQWVVPARGLHFPAIMLHDALVVGEGQPPTHIGPAVDREEADRIMRDAMGQLGVGLPRRWLAWTGAMLATLASKQPRAKWIALLLIGLLPIVALGVIATFDLFDWSLFGWKDQLPWMGDRGWFAELLAGGVAAVVLPLLWSVVWWKRWRVGAIAGVALAFVLHVTIIMGVAYAVYLLVDRLTRSRRRAEQAIRADQAALQQTMRISSQVGKGSATFIDLRIPRPFVRVTVTGPGMLVDGLKLVTDLGVLEGHSHPALVELAGKLEATAHCGVTGPVPVPITVIVDRQGPALSVGVGPPSMYETVVELRTNYEIDDPNAPNTTQPAPIEHALKETIAGGTGRGFVAGLVPIPAEGHPEDHRHDHDAAADLEAESAKAATDITGQGGGALHGHA